MLEHIIAFAAGFVLDLLFGDPYWMPHPIRMIGKWISCLERKWNIDGMQNREKIKKGCYMVLLVVFGTAVGTGSLCAVSYWIHPYFGIVVEAGMTYQILATKCLCVESMKVYKKLCACDLEGAREAVSMIVGRDTKSLNEKEIAKAAVETVAENTSDGVIAPMLYLALGGPVLGMTYKAINTMDSMVGYKNKRYRYFGYAAARLDDFVNFLPSRICAWIMIVASYVLSFAPIETEDGFRIFSGRQAIRIYRRDRRKHASPNSAQTESVCAGALGLRLAGDASYFGKKVKKPNIGDARREIESEDISRANMLLFGTASICELLCIGIMTLYKIMI